MFDLNKSYWLYIAPHVYCCIKERQALLYNTQTGERIETDRPEILALLESLHEKKNLGAICFNGKGLHSSSYREFIAEFCKKGMGNLVDMAQMPDKPVQMMPILNLQRDTEKLRRQEDRSIGEDILRYLLQLNIYIHTGCKQGCAHCNKYFRQSLCCTASSGKGENVLDISVLQDLLAQIQYGTVGQLNLLGGNLFEYPYYNDLTGLLANFSGQTHLWNHYTVYSCCKTYSSDFIQDIVVTFPVEDHQWDHCMTLLGDSRNQFHFYITNMEEYENAGNLIERYGIKCYWIHPVYTGGNDPFFKEHIFIGRDDIFSKKIPFRHIFAHQKLNTNFFGSLTISADGEIYGNVNTPSLGNIRDNPLLDTVNKEMTVNTSWQKIRDTRPCIDCLYQYLCPSPSSHELVMGRMNLCNIKK